MPLRRTGGRAGHTFANSGIPMQVVTLGEEPHYESFCMCGYRAKGPTIEACYESESSHLQTISQLLENLEVSWK